MCDILYLEEQTIGNRFFHMVLRGAELVTISQAPYFFLGQKGQGYGNPGIRLETHTQISMGTG